MALGANLGRIGRQLMAEAVLMAAIGALVAAGVAMLGDRTLRILLVSPGSSDGELSQRLGLVVGIALLSTILVSVAPLLQCRSLDLSTELRAGASTGGKESLRYRHMLVAGQAFLSTVLLIAAGLFVQSMQEIAGLDLGVDKARTVMIRFEVSQAALPKAVIQERYDQIRTAVQSLPGVRRVAFVDKNPYRNGWAVAVHTRQRSAESFWHPGVDQAPMAAAVDSGFFTTVGATVRGRDFSSDDRAEAPPVAIINEPLADLLWPGESAVGQCMFGASRAAAEICVTVVGVTTGFWRREITSRDQYVVYFPLAQHPVQRPAAMFVSTFGDARVLMPAMRRAVQAVLPESPAVALASLDEVLQPEIKPWRMAATMFSIFGVLALGLSAVGLFGLVSFSARQRSSEVAIRMALGARMPHVIWILTRSTMAAVGLGIVAGVTASLCLAPWIRGLLFQTGMDAELIGMALGALVVAAGIAVAGPVVRVTQADLGSNLGLK